MRYGGRTRGLGIFSTPSLPDGVKWLLIANVGIFILSFFATMTAPGRELFSYFALVPAAVVRWFFVWQLATYLFLHGGFSHIIWNMLALWMFGAELESVWGTRRFLQFYFFCGIGAGLCVIVANYLAGTPAVSTIGSSGAIYGILLAYAILFPNRTILWGFLIPIKVKYFVMIIGAISFLSAFRTVNSGVSEFAHLGGMLFAFLFLKTPRLQLSPQRAIRDQYQAWKLQRARRKFQVYLRRHGSDRDSLQ